MHERNETWKKSFFFFCRSCERHKAILQLPPNNDKHPSWIPSGKWMAQILNLSRIVWLELRRRKRKKTYFYCIYLPFRRRSQLTFVCLYSDFRLKTINRKMFYGRIRARLPSVHVNSPGHNSFWKLKINLGTSHWRHSNSPQPSKKSKLFFGNFRFHRFTHEKKNVWNFKKYFPPAVTSAAGRWMDKKID